MSRVRRKEVFFCSVRGLLHSYGLRAPQFTVFGKQAPIFFREVCHLFNRSNPLYINPIGKLPVSGLFELIKRIFNIRAVERFDVDTWHKDVRFFDLIDQHDEIRGSFYLDLYARENKRGGAWMDDCIGRKRKADG